MREREETEQRESPQFWKSLRLITPEKAQSIGIPSEGPVFSSPYTGRREMCKECGGQFGPLVYQAQAIVSAHHFCQEGGGIYYYSKGSAWITESNYPYNDGWVAYLRLMGKQISNRAEQVFVDSMGVFCMIDGHVGQELREGVVVGVKQELREGEEGSPEIENNRLFPCCSVDTDSRIKKHVIPKWKRFEYCIRPRFNFRVTEDGRVVFGNI